MNDERPRGELFRDPAAAVVWAAIHVLDEASQHEVLAALRQRLCLPEERESPHRAKVARAVTALRRAASSLGHSPSVQNYRRLRREHPDLDWPADGTIRRWLGGDWNAALKRAHLEAVPEADAKVPALGPRFTNDELAAAVRECAKELDRVPSFSDYLQWARRPDVKRRPTRRPSSQSPFERAFGGWRGALAAAGLVDDAGTGVPVSGGRGYRYTDQELFKALAEVRASLHGRFPSTSEYARQRELILRQQEEAGFPPRALPGYLVFARRFGSWARTRYAFERWRDFQPKGDASGEASTKDAKDADEESSDE